MKSYIKSFLVLKLPFALLILPQGSNSDANQPKLLISGTMRKGDGSHDTSQSHKEVSMDSTNYTHFAFNDNEEDSVVCKHFSLFSLIAY